RRSRRKATEVARRGGLQEAFATLCCSSRDESHDPTWYLAEARTSRYLLAARERVSESAGASGTLELFEENTLMSNTFKSTRMGGSLRTVSSSYCLPTRLDHPPKASVALRSSGCVRLSPPRVRGFQRGMFLNC